MENHRARPGIVEVTEQAYQRRQGIEDESRRRWWHIRTKSFVMTIICALISSLIVYWFVSSILENYHGARSQSDSSTGSSKRSYLERLSSNVLPLEYTLKILPVLEEGNFTAIGDLQIQFYCKAPTKHIRLHSHGLEVHELVLKEFRSLNTSKIINKYILKGDNFIDIFLLQFLISGETYVLRIKYSFPLNEDPRGLFRSKYIDKETNKKSWIAVSNFSPDYAHWAFPCFDEPWIKTPFRISIGRRVEMRSHSNSMRKITQEIHNMPGYVWDHYEKTLPMSTYVVAFMVTDFSSYSVDVTDRPYHTIFARKDVLKDTKYIGNLIPNVLRALQNLTGFYYEPDKLDVIIVPTLAYSAMENWGLITFREDNAVISNDTNTIDYKKSFADIAAHEVAHQWFGNLVTPKWWSHVWLKEGFSSFFGNLALQSIDPSWSLEDNFAAEFRDILESNGAQSAHPLHINLTTIRRLDGVFDETSYMMGNCVVYMIFHFLGESTFLAAIHRYMRTYYYRGADQENLWNAFQEEIDLRKSFPPNLTMSDVMRTWTEQAGFPILQIERDHENRAVLLTQHRFYNHGLHNTSKELWYVPLTWTTDYNPQFNNTLPKSWMTEKHMKINDSILSRAISDGKWMLFNVNLTGLYRVNYDFENWQLLGKSYKKLPRVTKAQLLSDAFAIAQVGLLNDTVPWELLQNLESETDELLWSTAMAVLNSIQHRLRDSNVFKFLTCKLSHRVYTMTSGSLMRSDPEIRSMFQINLMELSCSMGHRACLSTARELAEKLLLNNSYDSVPGEYRMGIYCAYVKVATMEQWLALLERYKDSEARDKDSLAYALGCHSNATLLRRFLSVISGNKTWERHMHLAFMSVINNPHGLDVAVEYFSLYWAKISKRRKESPASYNLSSETLIEILYAFSVSMDREENLSWLERLKGINEDYDVIIDDVINRVGINAGWNKKHKNETLKILTDIIENYDESPDCSGKPRRG